MSAYNGGLGALPKLLRVHGLPAPHLSSPYVFRCPSYVLFSSCWLFTTRRSTWPGNHLVPYCGWVSRTLRLDSCTSGFPNSKCLFNPSGLSLCLSIDHFCLVTSNIFSQLCTARIFYYLNWSHRAKLFDTMLKVVDPRRIIWSWHTGR